MTISWMDRLSGAIVRYLGVDFAKRGTLTFAGLVAVTDEPDTDSTVVTISGATPPTGTGLATVTASAWDLASLPMGSGIPAFLSTPTSLNLLGAITNETGSGSLVFASGPLLALPAIADSTGGQKYIFSVADLTADRTISLPLLIASDTFVFASHVQTLTGKTISGASNTLTVRLGIASSDVTGTLDPSNGGTGLAALGAGVATWWATPTSTNLLGALGATATGSGSCVFNTAPLFKTSINLNNPGNTFKYILTPAAIAADRVLTWPLLTADDTVVTQAFAQPITNKTISGANNTLTVRIGSDVSGLGANVATFLATPSSTNLLGALGSTATGSGAAVFGTAPTLDTPTVTGTTTWSGATVGIIAPTPVATTNATLTTIGTFPIAAGDLFEDIIITITARRTGGSGTAGDVYRADFPVCYQRIGAAAPTLVGAAAVETGKKSNGGGSAYVGSVAISGNNIVAQGTGVASTNISWTAVIQGQQV